MSDQNLTTAELDELTLLHKRASPGRVSIERRDDDDGSVDHIIHGARGDVAACFEQANNNSRANAAFIEALWNAAPALLAASRRSLEQDERIRELEAALGEAQRENELLRCGSLPSDLEGRERALGER